MTTRRAKAAPPEIRVFEDPEQLARAACAQIEAVVRAALERAGRCELVLSGGSTPRRAYELVARAGLPWERVQVWFGDERCVPPDSPESNFGMARRALFDPAGIPAANVHRIAGERDPEDAAADYEAELQQHFGLRPGGMPQFDLVLLGAGADGHAASLFPGSAALEEETRIVVANFVESLAAWRVTMTFPVFEAAARVLFLAAGGEKAAMVGAATVKRPVAATPPAGRIRPRGGVLTWLLDRAAAAQLEGGEGARAGSTAG